MSDEPNGDLFTAAVAMHEMFLSLIQAGFSETQALHIVSQMIRPAQQ